MGDSSDYIIFLGTAGARIMVSTQLLASGGMWLNLDEKEILLDPGPGCIVQSTKRKLNPRNLEAIILSHRHLDHAGDINIMIEAMTQGGFKKRGVVFAPAEALEEDPVVLRYLRGFPQRIEVLEESKEYYLNSVSLKSPVKHEHPAETYGFIFKTRRYTFSHIPDTKYFETLAQHYEGQLLIINVVRLEPGGPLQHLSIPEAGKIIGAIKPKVAILNHFGMTVWRARPWELAEKLSFDTGVKVLAARDGMKFDLSHLE